MVRRGFMAIAPIIATPVSAVEHQTVKVCGAKFTYGYVLEYDNGYWGQAEHLHVKPLPFTDEHGVTRSVRAYYAKVLPELVEAGDIDATPENVAKFRTCLIRALTNLHLCEGLCES